MKLTAIFLLLGCLNVSANGYAQQISINEKNAPLSRIFKEIKRQTGYTFAYTKAQLQRSRPITISVQNGSLEQVLDLCFRDQVFSYTIVNKTVVVVDRKPVASPAQLVSAEIPPIEISGIITNEKGEPLAGASITEKGTANAVISKDDGSFTIKIVDDNATIVISYVGFTTKEVKVNKSERISIALVRADAGLSDVVVVGYGTVKRRDLTGSVVSISSKDVKAQPINSFNQALQGRVSGVQITQASNSPGGGITIRVRGGNSISASNDPLYVIDGFPLATPSAASGAANAGASYANPLSTINPNDIESIEVLKDASATAIYGSRGANGVVLVTTKRGKAGKPTIDLESYAGIQTLIKKLELGNAMDHLNMKNEQLVNLGFPSRFGNPTSAYPKPVSGYGEGTDWQDEVFRTAPMQSHQLSISGGNDKIRYMVSGNYLDQDGIVIENNFKRYSTRVNLDAVLNNRVKLGANLTVSRTLNNGVHEAGLNSPVGAALTISPASTVYDATGNWQLLNFGPGTGFSSIANPVAVQKTSVNTLTSDRVLGNIFSDIEILKGLKARISVGADIYNTMRDLFYTPETLIGNSRNGYGSNGTSNNINLLNENTITYSRVFNRDHAFDFLAGVTFQKNREKRTYQEAEDFPNYTLKSNNLAGANKLIATNSSLEQWGLNSYLARINYRFKNRYLFTFTAREDGSSRFGKNNKYGFFPSGAFAWIASDEAFLQDIAVLNNLKFRVTYGVTGNDGIGLYNSLSRYSMGRYVFNDVEVLTNGLSKIENPDLKWEKTAQLDIGVDIGLFNNRINISADYYRKKTSDLLLNVELPATTGTTSVIRNVGSVENKGFELSINTVNIESRGDGFAWTTSLNASTNRNKVLSLANGVHHFFAMDQGMTGGVTTIVQVGQPIGSFYGNVFDGIWQTKEDIAAAGPLAVTGALPGAYRFKDVDGDGVYNEANDRRILGNGLPKYTFGMINNFSFKGFDLSIFLQGVQGNKIYNVVRTSLETSDPQTNSLKINVVDHWTPTNPSNQRAGIRQWRLPNVFDYYLEDGSFLRLKNVTLGYEVPVSSPFIKRARLYISGQNLYTLTDYRGFDPEVNSNMNNNSLYGVDNFAYPPARTFLVGLNLSF